MFTPKCQGIDCDIIMIVIFFNRNELAFQFYNNFIRAQSLHILNQSLDMKISILIVSCYFIAVQAFGQLPTGSIAKIPLNTNASDIGGNGYNGSLTSTSNTTNRFGTGSEAQAFTSGTSTGTLPVGLITAMDADFSLGFWFKTSMTANTGAQWYNGNSLVDAEVAGVTNDFGICLIDGGKVCFGIGNPDITIKSTSSTYNDGAWHFVTATRNKAAGTIILYIDGASVASTTGTNTGLLNAPALLGLGRSSAVATGTFTGSLDDIVVYNRVLSAAEVSAAYTTLNAVVLPLNWLSFYADNSGNKTNLTWVVGDAINNNYFDVEYSNDAVSFIKAGRVNAAEGRTITSGQLKYHFQMPAVPSGAVTYYRIRQTDMDGVSSLSKTILVKQEISLKNISIQYGAEKQGINLINAGGQMINQISIVGVEGKVISTKQVRTTNNIIPVNIHGLKPGHYFLIISGSEGNLSLPIIRF